MGHSVSFLLQILWAGQRKSYLFFESFALGLQAVSLVMFLTFILLLIQFQFLGNLGSHQNP